MIVVGKREVYLKRVLACFAFLFLVSCQTTSGIEKPERAGNNLQSNGKNLESVLSRLTLRELDQAALVFRVAFDRSLESWQTPDSRLIAGCSLNGALAEEGLLEVRPWLERRASEEAKRLLAAPRNYQLLVDEKTCLQDCSCSLGLRILEAAELEKQPSSKVKNWKRLKSTLEAKSELLSSQRAEFCADSTTWICSSELLNLLRKPK